MVRFLGRIVMYNFQDTEDALLYTFVGLLVRSLSSARYRFGYSLLRKI